MTRADPGCIVVGLGAVGSAVLYQLAKRGIPAVGLDMFSPPHDRGSSHGTSRITRQAVGEGERYVAFVKTSHDIWNDLHEETGADLFLKAGCLTIEDRSVASKPDFTRTALSIARTYAIPYQQFTDTELRARYPQFRIRDGATGFLEINAGILFPEACVAAQLNVAERLGATVLRGEAFTRLEREGAALAVVTAGGARHVAPHVVIATGAWLPAQIGAPFAAVKVERQARLTFEPGPSPSWTARDCPAFIRLDRSDGQFVYGFPELPGAPGVTIASEQHAATIDPNGYDRSVPAAEKAAFYETFIKAGFNGLSATCLDARTCLYTTTPTAHFVIDRHPDFEGATIVSACSGHGFKHSAGIGHYVASHLTGDLDPAFSLRNALTPARQAHA